jgi:hypothetical protein
MDAGFDTGPILAQGSVSLGRAERAEDVLGALFGLWASLLPRALERVEAGDAGDPQVEDGASYAGFFEPEFAEVDWSRSAEEVHRQVRAWWVAAARDGVRGPLAELGGERVYARRRRRRHTHRLCRRSDLGARDRSRAGRPGLARSLIWRFPGGRHGATLSAWSTRHRADATRSSDAGKRG